MSLSLPEKVLICGDRNWGHSVKEKKLIKDYIESLPLETIIIEGEAQGADKIAGSFVKERGMKVLKFPADWKKYGKAAGPIRNKQMLDEKPDLVVAFHNDIESSKGTKNTIIQAKKMNIPFVIMSVKKETRSAPGTPGTRPGGSGSVGAQSGLDPAQAGSDFKKNLIKDIHFYDPKDKYGEFSNYYISPFTIGDITYQSVEHYYQSKKFTKSSPELKEKTKEYRNLIITADTPNKAKILASQKKKGGYGAIWKHSKNNSKTLNELISEYKEVKVRPDWEEIKITVMIKGVCNKFKQNERLMKLLLSTNGKISEHTDKDLFWGDGGDKGEGRDELGKILVTLRDEVLQSKVGREGKEEKKEETRSAPGTPGPRQSGSGSVGTSSDLKEEKKEEKYSDTYTGESPSYKDLIKKGIVKDETGRVDIIKFTEEQRQRKLKSSVLGIGRIESGDFNAWKSNLQKCIRQCDVEGALKSMVETCSWGGPFLSNIINRMCKVIVSEDIGPAEPDIAKICRDFLVYYDKHKKECKLEPTEEMKKELIKLTYRLTVAHKSRLADNLLFAVDKKKRDEEYVIKNDEDFKEKTSLFKKVYEDNNINKLEKLELLTYLTVNIERYKSKGITVKSDIPVISGKKIPVYVLWNFLLKRRPQDIHLLHIYISDKNEGVLNIMNCMVNCVLDDVVSKFKYEKSDEEEFDKFDWDEIKKQKIWIKSESYDKHTAAGKGMENRNTIKFFFEYGAKLKNKRKELEYYDDVIYNKCMEKLMNK